MDWETAVDWYHRALACLPNLFGSDKQIRPLPMWCQGRVAFKPQHASRIYAALGRALTALNRKRDGWLAFQAAAALDPGNNSPKGCTVQPDGRAVDVPAIRNNPEGLKIGSRSRLMDSITLIMVTHCTKRLEKFKALSPPSNKLVTATFGSLTSVFGEEISTCPKIMCYDSNPNGCERDAQYAQSIEAFCRENGFLLQRFPGIGLFNVLNRIIPSIETPFLFFLEHDWMFQGEKIMLPAIIELMNNDQDINAIRFNKRHNYLNGQDFLMEVDSVHGTYPLMRTSSYSNNPSIIRTEKLKNEWLPICGQALRLVADDLGGSAFGVEEILFRNHVRDIRAQGFRRAHAQWGLHIYGNVGDPPRVMHLGE
ncbi:MAG: hypothetical protein P8X96_21615 [Desulfobacteraceae bacterium]